ncbi:hypothetical protein P3S68_019622 [Capsicum galapagoense]
MCVYMQADVEVPSYEPYHRVVDGITRADAYCLVCRNLLGWKLIAVSQPCMFYREGRFVMKLEKLIYWDDTTLLQHYEEHVGDLGANEQNSDQVGSANEQDPNDRDGGTNEQVHDELDLGTNEQNSDQDGDADEQVPNDQDLGANEQNADQDLGTNEQVPNEQDQREILSQDCIHCRICKTQVAFVEDYVPDIAVSQPSWHFREGRFYMRLDKLIYWNNVTLLHFLFGIGGANEQAPDDQAGGVMNRIMTKM